MYRGKTILKDFFTPTKTGRKAGFKTKMDPESKKKKYVLK